MKKEVVRTEAEFWGKQLFGKSSSRSSHQRWKQPMHKRGA